MSRWGDFYVRHVPGGQRAEALQEGGRLVWGEPRALLAESPQGDPELFDVGQPVLLLGGVDALVEVALDLVEALPRIGVQSEEVATNAGVLVGAA